MEINHTEMFAIFFTTSLNSKDLNILYKSRYRTLFFVYFLKSHVICIVVYRIERDTDSKKVERLSSESLFECVNACTQHLSCHVV